MISATHAAMRGRPRHARLLALTVVGLVLAGAAPHGPAQWFLVVHEQPPGVLGPFPTERDCAQELVRRRTVAETGWRRTVSEYYDLLAVALDPSDDASRAERVVAYQRVLYYQRFVSLYRAATCEPDIDQRKN